MRFKDIIKLLCYTGEQQTIHETGYSNKRSAHANLPYDLDDTIGNDKHFPRNLSASANEVSWCKNISLHLQNQIVEKLGLTFLENCHLIKKITTHGVIYTLQKKSL